MSEVMNNDARWMNLICLVEQQGTLKHIFLYCERRFIKLGYDHGGNTASFYRFVEEPSLGDSDQ